MAAQSTPGDHDGDGCVGATDVLFILGMYGECQDTWCADSVLFDNYWYETVLIGDQCWFAENLRTRFYADGTAIAEITDDAWAWLNGGARCDYDNNSANVATYGRLYNWYAVDDARGLCPSGWHVPTDGEWTELEDYITALAGCYDGIEGTALKSTSGWSDGDNGADYFGFSALPGGKRLDFGTHFEGAGAYGHWWSSSPEVGFDCWFRRLIYDNPGMHRASNSALHGHSVRCLRDSE